MEKAKSAVWVNDRLKLIRESSGRAGREGRKAVASNVREGKTK
jgi:hypothetical protein